MEINIDSFNSKANNLKKENESFYRKLKSKPPKDLDEKFHSLHDEVFEEIESQVKAAGTESAATIAVETEVLVTRAARNAVFESLKTDLTRVSHLASALRNNKLRMPARARTHDLIATGEAFLEAAPSMKEELATHRFPESLDSLFNAHENRRSASGLPGSIPISARRPRKDSTSTPIAASARSSRLLPLSSTTRPPSRLAASTIAA